MLDLLTDQNTFLSIGASPSWSPDGSRILYECWTYGICVMNPDGSAQRTLLTRDAAGANWSPSGDAISYTSYPGIEVGVPFTGESSVWLMNPDGTSRRRLSPVGRSFYSEGWSPDGQRLLIAHSPAEPLTGDLYAVSVDGSDLTQLTDYEGYEGMATWSPDGDWIAFTHQPRGESASLCLVQAANQKAVCLATGNSPPWGPLH